MLSTKGIIDHDLNDRIPSCTGSNQLKHCIHNPNKSEELVEVFFRFIKTQQYLQFFNMLHISFYLIFQNCVQLKQNA